MPRAGRRRKKRRTEKELDLSEQEKRDTPRCFVIKRGHVGDRIRDLVRDFREVMMPNCAKSLKESKNNRVEDFIAVAAHFHVSHLILFTATKSATYMKMSRLPQGPTLTFRVDSFSTTRDVKASQKRPRGGVRDFTSAPLQVLNGFGAAGAAGGSSGSTAPELGKPMQVSERQLAAEMLRGMFPAIDVPTFNQAECRRTALFHYDKESDAVHFRHYSVARRTTGLQRGVSKLLRPGHLPKLGRRADIADFVLGGGGASESEAEDATEVSLPNGGNVGIRLTETGPRLKLLLIKAEEGVCTGGVMYHRYQMKTPSQQQVLEERARQRRKLRERNQKIDAKIAEAKKKRKKPAKEKLNDGDDGEEDEDMPEGRVGPDSDEEDAPEARTGGKGGSGGKNVKKSSPFGFGAKALQKAAKGQQATVSLDDRPGKKNRRGGAKKREAGEGPKGSQKVLDRFKQSQKRSKS